MFSVGIKQQLLATAKIQKRKKDKQKSDQKRLLMQAGRKPRIYKGDSDPDSDGGDISVYKKRTVLMKDFKDLARLDPRYRRMEMKREEIARNRFRQVNENDSHLQYILLYFQTRGDAQLDNLTIMFNDSEIPERKELLVKLQELSGKYSGKSYGPGKENYYRYGSALTDIFIRLFLYKKKFASEYSVNNQLNVLDVLNLFIPHIKNIVKGKMDEFVESLDNYKEEIDYIDPMSNSLKLEESPLEKTIKRMKVLGLPKI
jgi:hypothetical protein